METYINAGKSFRKYSEVEFDASFFKVFLIYKLDVIGTVERKCHGSRRCLGAPQAAAAATGDLLELCTLPTVYREAHNFVTFWCEVLSIAQLLSLFRPS